MRVNGVAYWMETNPRVLIMPHRQTLPSFCSTGDWQVSLQDGNNGCGEGYHVNPAAITAAGSKPDSQLGLKGGGWRGFA